MSGAIMHVPGFLRQDSTQGPAFPEEGESRSHGYAARGCLIGLILSIVFWFVPIPIAAVVWVLGLKGPFGDFMLIAIPFYIALPLIGAVIGELAGRKRVAWRQRRMILEVLHLGLAH